MQTRVMASLNGVSMHQVDPSIIIQKVTEAAPSWNVTAGSKATLIGQRYGGTERRFREVQIAFAIAEMRNLQSRETVLQKVASWAAEGGALTLSYRPGQWLFVVCASLPAVNGIDAWAENYTITLRAYDKPYWENAAETTVTKTGASASISMNMANISTDWSKLQIRAVNSSGSVCNTLQVTANGETFKMAGLGLANGETFEVDYDDKDIQRIRIRSSGGVYRSALAKRTTDSADDLKVKPNVQNTIACSANVSLAWTMSTHGRWQG